MILQLFTTFAVYADTRVNLSIGSYSMPAAHIKYTFVIAGIIAGPLIEAWTETSLLDPIARFRAPSRKGFQDSFS